MLVAAPASSARADFILVLSDGIAKDTVVLKDTGGTGMINYSGSIGNFNIVVTTALSQPVIGDANNAILHLNNISVMNKGGGTLTITTSDTGYSFPFLASGTNMAVNSSVGGVLTPNSGSTGSFSSQAWFDGSDAGYTQSGGVYMVPTTDQAVFGSGGFGTATSGSFSGDASVGAVYYGQFALINQATFTFGAKGGQGSFDEITSINAPAPSSLVLVLSAVPLGLVYMRRRFQIAPV
jgi:hypothetical protein